MTSPGLKPGYVCYISYKERFILLVLVLVHRLLVCWDPQSFVDYLINEEEMQTKVCMSRTTKRTADLWKMRRSSKTRLLGCVHKKL